MNKDNLHDITKWIDHNRGQFFGTIVPIILVAVMFGIFGCSKTQSLNDPAVKVDRQTFTIECLAEQETLKAETIDIEGLLEKHNAKVESHNQRKQAGLDDLARQDEVKNKVLEVAGGAIAQYASGGSVSIAPLIMSALNLGAIGWGVGNKLDNSRKDKVISEKKAKTA